MNLSQDEFAAALRAAGLRAGESNSASKRLVQRWESGAITGVRPAYRRALEAVTGRSFSELGFALPREAAEEHAASRSALKAHKGLAGVLEVFAGRQPERHSPKPGEMIGGEFVAMLTERTARLRRLDDFLGGADTLPLYASEVQATVAVLRSCSYGARTGTRLAGVLAEQAQQAGWAAFDTGALASAAQLYRLSLTAAREAGDPALACNALALLGYQAGPGGQASTLFARAAYEQAERHAPAAVCALLAQRLGWAHATAGQADAAQRSLDLAGAHLLARQDEQIPDWAAWADEHEQRIIEGRCWVELARPSRAVPILEAALADYDEAHARNKALFLTWLAAAYLDAREIEAAAATLTRATATATTIASPRLARRIEAVSRGLKPYKTVPQVSELIERTTGQ